MFGQPTEIAREGVVVVEALRLGHGVAGCWRCAWPLLVAYCRASDRGARSGCRAWQSVISGGISRLRQAIGRGQRGWCGQAAWAIELGAQWVDRASHPVQGFGRGVPGRQVGVARRPGGRQAVVAVPRVLLPGFTVHREKVLHRPAVSRAGPPVPEPKKSMKDRVFRPKTSSSRALARPACRNKPRSSARCRAMAAGRSCSG